MLSLLLNSQVPLLLISIGIESKIAEINGLSIVTAKLKVLEHVFSGYWKFQKPASLASPEKDWVPTTGISISVSYSKFVIFQSPFNRSEFVISLSFLQDSIKKPKEIIVIIFKNIFIKKLLVKSY